mmetsp:Transcript_24257/g.55167  ORF Transcript_24257/g.55167 Transcript_24257/m.55167 type:complete len:280 (-) Transcript_24257:2833-3672(-)
MSPRRATQNSCFLACTRRRPPSPSSRRTQPPTWTPSSRRSLPQASALPNAPTPSSPSTVSMTCSSSWGPSSHRTPRRLHPPISSSPHGWRAASATSSCSCITRGRRRSPWTGMRWRCSGGRAPPVRLRGQSIGLRLASWSPRGVSACSITPSAPLRSRRPCLLMTAARCRSRSCQTETMPWPLSSCCRTSSPWWSRARRCRTRSSIVWACLRRPSGPVESRGPWPGLWRRQRTTRLSASRVWPLAIPRLGMCRTCRRRAPTQRAPSGLFSRRTRSPRLS